MVTPSRRSPALRLTLAGLWIFLAGIAALILALASNVMIHMRSFGPELEPGLTILRLAQGLINATLVIGAGSFAAGLGWMIVRAMTKRG